MIRGENQVRFAGVATEDRYWNAEAETLSEERIAALQADGLALAWDRVWATPKRFFADKFSTAGLGPDRVPKLDDIPRTTKAELRENELAHPPFGNHRAVSLEDAVRVSKTSGTSGRPVFSLIGPSDLEAAIEMQCRTTWTLGMRPGGRFTHPWPGGLYVSSAFTNFVYVRTGVLELPVGLPENEDIAREHISVWQMMRPNGFMLTTSQLHIYMDAAESMGVDFTSLTAGTVVSLIDFSMNFSGPRTRMEQLLACDIRTQSGAGDIPGFGAAECRYRTGVHLPNDYLIVQVVDPDTGRSVPDGEQGHLVVTTIGMDANLVRFDLEDIASLEVGPCPCGRTGPRLRVFGRAAEAVRLEGKVILPAHIQDALDDYGAPEFEVHVVESRKRRALVVSIDEILPQLEAQSVLKAKLKVPCVVETVSMGSRQQSAFKPRRVK